MALERRGSWGASPSAPAPAPLVAHFTESGNAQEGAAKPPIGQPQGCRRIFTHSPKLPPGSKDGGSGA